MTASKTPVCRRQRLNERAIDTEVLDSTPVEVPPYVESRGADSLRTMIQNMVRNEMSRAAVSAGAGSFEEEDDFELEEREPPMLSGYEVIEMDGELESLEGTPDPEGPSLEDKLAVEGKPVSPDGAGGAESGDNVEPPKGPTA